MLLVAVAVVYRLWGGVDVSPATGSECSLLHDTFKFPSVPIIKYVTIDKTTSSNSNATIVVLVADDLSSAICYIR